MDCQSLAHSSGTNHVTKCPGDVPGQVIGINSILSSPDVMLLTMFSTHAATCNHSVDCDTDHSLICASIRMQPKRFFHSKQKGHIRINISNTTYTEKNQQFIESIRTALSGIETESSEENWNTLFVTSYTTLHSQHTAKNNERTLTGTRQTSL